MTYDVHLFALVRVKVPGVEADSQRAAIEAAEKAIDLYQIASAKIYGAECVEYAEEIVEALVDEEGDPEYSKSTWFNLRAGFSETPSPSGVKR